MKPMFKQRVSLAVNPAPFPCNICSNPAITCSGQYIFTGMGGLVDDESWTTADLGDSYHPDTVALPSDMRSELAGRAEASLPHLFRGLPNLIRSLVELKDMAATVRSVANTLNLLLPKRAPSEALMATLESCKRENTNFWQAARAFRAKAKTGVRQTLAGDVLAWKFAIAPYVDDFKHLVLNSARIAEEIKQLQVGMGKVHTLKVYAHRDDVSSSESGEFYRCTADCAGCPCRNSTSPVPESYTNKRTTRTSLHSVLTLKYTYDLPQWAKEELKQSEALLKYLSAGLTKETVFELIPFSFVLEWFLNARPLLAGNLLGINKTQADCQVSIVDTALTYIIEEGVTSTTGEPLRGILQTEVGTRKYVYRWVGEQAMNRLAWVFKLPSWMQLALGAAMVNSNVSYHS